MSSVLGWTILIIAAGVFTYFDRDVEKEILEEVKQIKEIIKKDNG